MALQALHDAYSDADPALLLHAVPELVLQTLNCVKDVFLKRVQTCSFVSRVVLKELNCVLCLWQFFAIVDVSMLITDGVSGGGRRERGRGAG